MADALSRKAIMALRVLNVRLSLVPNGTILAKLRVKPSLLRQIQEARMRDEKLMTIMGRVKEGKETNYEMKRDGCLHYKSRICIPGDEQLKKNILAKAHSSFHAMYPGSTKMYHDLKAYYWWPGMKKEIGHFATRCLTCQQVKTEHQVPSRLLEPISIPE